MKKANTRLAAILLALVMILTVLPVAGFASEAAEPILIVPAPIAGITVPVKGEMPNPPPGTALPDGIGYTVELDSWLDGNRDEHVAGESFAAGTLYAARVMLTAKEGYAFKYNTSDQATIDYGQGFKPDDATAALWLNSEVSNIMYLTIEYSKTESEPHAVTIAPASIEVNGVTATATVNKQDLVAAGDPVTATATLDGTPQKTGTFFWTLKSDDNEIDEEGSMFVMAEGTTLDNDALYRVVFPMPENDVNLTWTFTFTEATVPDAPVVTATPGDRKVTLSWDTPHNGGSPIMNYLLAYGPAKENGEPGDLIVSDISIPPDATSYVADGLTNGTRYGFLLVAYNAKGGNENSKTVFAIPTAGGGGSVDPDPVDPDPVDPDPVDPPTDNDDDDDWVPSGDDDDDDDGDDDDDDDRRGSSGDGGSSSTSAATVNTPATPVTTANATDAASKAVAAALDSGAPTATANLKNPGEISLAALQAMDSSTDIPLRLQADSTVGNAVDVRITLDPALATEGLNLSASTTSDAAKKTAATFEKYYSNTTATVSFGQAGSFGQRVDVAAKVDLALMDTKRLVFYSYDPKTNVYKRIEAPEYWIDANGYLHFKTELAGEIVISEGELEKR